MWYFQDQVPVQVSVHLNRQPARTCRFYSKVEYTHPLVIGSCSSNCLPHRFLTLTHSPIRSNCLIRQSSVSHQPTHHLQKRDIAPA
ncbi:hypothetical protein J3E69DRAFT_345853 [Trichoderma sp. SZMC 28015]